MLHGMPCHKYIIHCLASERDMLIFEKSLAETMLSNGYTNSQIEDCLALLSQQISRQSPISGKLFDIHGDGIYLGNLVDSLCLDNSIPKYQGCKAYYGTYDESCRACQLCIYSPLYKNSLYEKELTVLRYIFSSADNFERMKANGLKATSFKSNVDIVNVISSAKHPVLYPLFKELYKLLNASYDRYFNWSEAGSRLEHRFYVKLADNIYNLSLPQECYQNDWIRKQISYFEEIIFSLDICTDDVADAYLSEMLSRKKYTPPVVSKLKEKKPTPDAAQSVSGTTTRTHTKKRVAKPDNSASVSEKDTGTAKEVAAAIPDSNLQNQSVSNAAAATTANLTPLPDIGNRVNQSAEVHNQSNNAMTDNHPVQNRCVQKPLNATLPSTDVIEVIDNHDAYNEPYIYVNNRQVHKFETYPTSMDMEGDLIFIPSVTWEELKACGVSLNTNNALILTRFETAVMHDPRLPIEVVRTDTASFVLLMWIPLLRTFFYSDLSSAASNEILLPLLSHKSITKITYSPYWLYSIIYHTANAQLRSLNSIQTMHYLFPTNDMDYISAMLSYGVEPACSGADFYSAKWIESMVFRLLPLYTIVNRKLQRRVRRAQLQSKLDMAVKLSEALGTSFDLSFLLHENKFLFSMPHPFVYKFNPVDLRLITQPGYIVTYRVSCIDQPEHDVFGQVLYMLADRGRFKRLRMQLIDYYPDKLVLYIPDQSYSYVSEIMSRTLFDYSEAHSSYGISLSIDHIRIEPKFISE